MKVRPVLSPRSSNSKHNLCYRSSVIREIEIWRVAMLTVNRYAAEAEANSFGRAKELTEEGDHAGRLFGVESLSRSSSITDTTGPCTDD